MAEGNNAELNIETVWEGQGSGSRFDYGAMGSIDLEMVMRGRSLLLAFGYSDMNMEPLSVTIIDQGMKGEEGYHKVIAHHEWYSEDGELWTRRSAHERVEVLDKLTEDQRDAMLEVLGDETYDKLFPADEERVVKRIWEQDHVSAQGNLMSTMYVDDERFDSYYAQVEQVDEESFKWYVGYAFPPGREYASGVCSDVNLAKSLAEIAHKHMTGDAT